MMQFFRRVLFLAGALVFVTAGAQQNAAEEGPARLEAVKQLPLSRLPSGALPTYYSKGARSTALHAQEFIEGERAFYVEHLHMASSSLTLAVLNPRDWAAVDKALPYGMPSVEGRPRVILLPIAWAAPSAIPLPLEGEVTPALQRQALATGKPWDELMSIGADGIGGHEVGHTIAEDYGIGHACPWFAEFMANLVVDSYVAAARPEELTANQLFWKGMLLWPHPHTSLSYLDEHYDQVAANTPKNYAWYQANLDERALEVYRQQGFAIFPKLRAAFPKGGPALSSDQVLDRLEAIQPGWKAWANHLEAQ